MGEQLKASAYLLPELCKLVTRAICPLTVA